MRDNITIALAGRVSANPQGLIDVVRKFLRT